MNPQVEVLPALEAISRPNLSRLDSGKSLRRGSSKLGNLIEIQDGVPLYSNQEAEASTLSDR